MNDPNLKSPLRIGRISLYGCTLLGLGLAAWQTVEPPTVAEATTCCQYASTDCPKDGKDWRCETGSYCSPEKPRYCQVATC